MSFQIKQLFGVDFENYQKEFEELDSLDNVYTRSITDFNANATLSEMQANITFSNEIETIIRTKSEKLIDLLPKEFKSKIKLYSGYSNAFDFSGIYIEEGETKNNNSDFGITCL